MQHSPGPWRIERENHVYHSRIEDNYGVFVAAVGDSRSPRQGSTDAMLIAAAPELLAACEETLRTLNTVSIDIDTYNSIARLLGSAIEKATGVSR